MGADAAAGTARAAVAATFIALLVGAVPASATTGSVFGSSQGPSTLFVEDLAENRDVVVVTLAGGSIRVTDTGAGGISPGQSCTTVDEETITCLLDPPDPPSPASPTLPVGNVQFFGSRGDDEFTLAAPFDGGFLSGGDGSDRITGGPRQDGPSGGEGPDQLFGMGGDDFLDGGEGNDTLVAGEGDDELADGGFDEFTGGTDSLDGGPGSDRSFYFRMHDLNLSLDDVANDGLAGEGDNLIAMELVGGGLGDDTLIGNDAANEIFAAGGNDTIRGLGGNDLLEGSEGDDLIEGGAGRDEFFCGSGLDTALFDALDLPAFGCETSGAGLDVQTATVNRKGKMKIPVSCGTSEAANCTGRLVLTLNGKRIGKGTFDVEPGETKRAKAKLTKSGSKAMKRNGGTVLATAEVVSDVAGGVSTREEDLLLRQKAGKSNGKKGS